MQDVPADKMVVLGLVTTKSMRQEKPTDLMARIKDATRYVDLDRLAISPQCGFATSVVGNAITVEDEKRKLGVLVETARRVWEE